MPTTSGILYKRALDAAQAARDARVQDRERAEVAFNAERERRFAATAKPKGLKGKKLEAWIGETRHTIAQALLAEDAAKQAFAVDAAHELTVERLRAEADKLALEVKVVAHDLSHMLVRTAHSDSFRTQGWGAADYARETLRPVEFALTRAKIPHHVDTVNPRNNGDHAEFQLWAMCEAWEADCLERQLTFIEALRSHGPTANCRVLYPSLAMNHEQADALLRQAGRQV